MVFRQQEIDTQFFTPRAYQQELVEKALERNVIVALGTGTGKTFIAVRLIEEMAAALRRPWDEGGQRSFFIVDKVALVRQQAEQLRSGSDLSVGEYHGGRNVDLWNEARWLNELQQHQVLVLTAQIFYDLLQHGFLAWPRVCCLVLDECHHALGKAHPYRLLMDHYKRQETHQPRVLGLTASVISASANPAALRAQIRELESALAARLQTTSDVTQVAKYGAKPKIRLIIVRDFHPTPVAIRVNQMLKACLDFSRHSVFHADFDLDPTKPFHEALKRIISILDLLGPWAAWKVCGLWETQLRKLNAYNLTELQEMFNCMALTYIRATKILLSPMEAVASVQQLQPHIPDKILRLLEVLKQLNPANRPPEERKDDKRADEFSGIIFVEQRYVAYILKTMLKKVQSWDPASFGYLRLDFVIGVSGWNVAAEESLALHRRQEQVLRQFRARQLNLLIATSVLEEGVDVRHCNLVLRFDPPKDYRSYVQSRGRARKEKSLYVMLVEEALRDTYLAKLKEFAQIEMILHEHSQTDGNPPAQTLEPDLLSAAEQLARPYVVPAKTPDGAEARVTIATAVALVNRYCAKLPSDIFTKLVPRCDVEELGDGLFRASLVLPINSPVKETLYGVPMKNKKLAQMSVALEVCKELHRRGELDDHLLPVGKESVCRLLNQIEDDAELWPLDGRARPGSTKRKQYYHRLVPDALRDSRPLPDLPCYLHALHFSLQAPATGAGNPKNRPLVDLAESPRFLGLLSRKPFPPLPAFPLFARQGRLSCQLQTTTARITLAREQLQLLSNFHRFLFADILKSAQI